MEPSAATELAALAGGLGAALVALAPSRVPLLVRIRRPDRRRSVARPAAPLGHGTGRAHHASPRPRASACAVMAALCVGLRPPPGHRARRPARRGADADPARRRRRTPLPAVPALHGARGRRRGAGRPRAARRRAAEAAPAPRRPGRAPRRALRALDALGHRRAQRQHRPRLLLLPVHRALRRRRADVADLVDAEGPRRRAARTRRVLRARRPEPALHQGHVLRPRRRGVERLLVVHARDVPLPRPVDLRAQPRRRDRGHGRAPLDAADPPGRGGPADRADLGGALRLVLAVEHVRALRQRPRREPPRGRPAQPAHPRHRGRDRRGRDDGARRRASPGTSPPGGSRAAVRTSSPTPPR